MCVNFLYAENHTMYRYRQKMKKKEYYIFSEVLLCHKTGACQEDPGC